ncbi:MAG: methyltransferase domain-containing protein [Bacteroidota bacterium]|nr:methyltransferase domain-containing protein [Bacteroidota bacterium]
MTVFVRSTQKEIMDDVSIHDKRLDDALHELTVINTWLGGHSTSRKGMRKMLKHLPKRPALSVLDVGAGGSDLLAAISPLHRNISMTSLDLNLRACEYSAEAYPSIALVNGSVLALPFKEQSFDIVHASLFLHHFMEDELQAIFLSLYSVARQGIIINDLRRSVLSYYGIMLLTRLFSRSAMVKNDGPISVRRGFMRNELARLCASLPSASYTIQRTWAFRWLVCIVKDNE